jgi:hypothetical protein
MSLKKISGLDARYLYLILLILSSIPILMPLGLPLAPSALTRSAYDFIENLPPGSVVILDAQHSTGYGPELGTQFAALMKHLLSRPLKVVIVALGAEGPMLVDMTFKGSTLSGSPINPDAYGKVYGEDYIFVGYIAGGETAIAAFARNSWITEVDGEQKKPLSEFPIMEYCKTVDDWSLAISVSGGNFEQMVAQWYSAYGTPIIFGAPGVSAPRLYPYIGAGQVVAMLVSLTGAAEYELLIRKPGLAASLMDVLNLAQLLIVASIVIGNIIYFATRQGGRA